MKRFLRTFARAFGSLGHPGAPDDLGFALPRPDCPPAGYPADRSSVPLSAREEEAFRLLADDLAR
ncbi:hypothetical protein FHX82_004860 [Amycolatopsis bartoniae]|uniref:hypothetical protein n=1 Tax=Amycolatopsis bartoniae TaxID=941986 RepID=UPI0017CEE525|nr:hypothetical protein [Amycolatopsis bartoniae]MBB2937784.1 hypothetical protein [Amycolatopsis bartoniae]